MPGTGEDTGRFSRVRNAKLVMQMLCPVKHHNPSVGMIGRISAYIKINESFCVGINDQYGMIGIPQSVMSLFTIIFTVVPAYQMTYLKQWLQSSWLDII
jgi:hypothetical protein